MPQQIILLSHKQKIANRIFQTAVALTVWSIVIAFIARIITAFVWYFLSRLIFKELSVPEAFIDAVVLLEYLLIFSLFVLFLNYAWAKYNYLRYGKHERRKHPGYNLKNKTLVKLSGRPLAKIIQLQKANKILLQLNDKKGLMYRVLP